MSLICIYTAAPGQGKTFAALTSCRRSTVFFAPDRRNANALVKRMDWINARDLTPAMLPALARRGAPWRCIIAPGFDNPSIISRFTQPCFSDFDFIFDDFPIMFFGKKSLDNFVKFASGIRHRKGRAIITTQRVKGIIPPFVRALTDEIVQVGPLASTEEAKTLYEMGNFGGFRNFDDFFNKISHLNKYQQMRIK